MSNYFLITFFIFYSIFALSMPILAAYDYNIEIIFKDISAKDLPDSSIIWLRDIKAPSSFQQYTQEFENQLLLTLIKCGYTITKNSEIKASHRLDVEIKNIEVDSYNKFIWIYLSIKLKNLITNENVVDRDITLYPQHADSNLKTVGIIGNLNYLAGGEVEAQNLSVTNNSKNRASSVNEKDIQAGIQVLIPSQRIHSVILLRTRNSFGRDDLKLYKIYFETNFRRTTFLCGIFPLKFGISSHYLNSTVQRPYWNRGLIFDSHLTGLSVSQNFKHNKLTLYYGTNRNPSMVFASKWEFDSYGQARKNHINLSLFALYVNRDDNYNDIGQSLGFEIRYQLREKLFLYGLSATKYFNGNGVNLERKIIPFLGEYQYYLTKKWILKGAYLSVKHWVETDGWSIEETIYKEVDFQVSKHWVPGVQYERFYIYDFWENNFTAVFYYNPLDFNSELIKNIGITFKFRYINPKLGANRFFFGIEGRIQF